jgi:hypothetical protein
MTEALRKEEQFQWTDAAIEILKARWAEGTATQNIGNELRTTKGSVIGKALRLNLGPHTRGKGGRDPKPTTSFFPRTKPRAAKITARRGWIERRPIARVIHIAPDPACKVPFLEVGKRQCRYPLWGEGYTPLNEKFVCGAVTAKDHTYCGFHDTACYWKDANLRPVRPSW